MKQTFFQICVTLCILIFMFNLAVSYVSAMGIYGDTPTGQGAGLGDTVNESINAATESPGYPSGFNTNTLWAIVLTGIALGSVVAWLTHSAAIIGVSIFSFAFWASYINTLGILEIGSYIDPGFMLIATAGMGMVWIGAVAGMLSGSG